MILDRILLTTTHSKLFPFDLPFYQVDHLDFINSVTFFVGENGSGKSTLLELIQEKIGLIRIEQSSATLALLRQSLHEAKKSISLVYKQGLPKGFYFGAEDFTSYIHQLTAMKHEAKEELGRVEKEYANRSVFARNQAASPYQRDISEMERLYDKDLLTSSHGEAYLSFFSSRIRANELYILDEPETPLSVQNQLALMVLIHEAVKKGCQFIIATHSPILLSYPNASIYELSNQKGIEPLSYQEVSQVQLLKQFLASPEAFFHHMFK